MAMNIEHLPSGKDVLRTLDVEGRLVKEMHSYGMLEIGCTMEFAAGKKFGETYIVKKRVAGRKRYEKARVDFPDMPEADESLPDTGAELIRLMGIERKQKAAANKRRKEDPLTDEQKREAARQIPLFQAVSKDLVTLRQLLDAGEDPNAVAVIGGFTPLYNACVFGELKPEKSLAAVRLLLERGADPNKRFEFESQMDGRTERGLTALMIAGTGDVAEALLAAGAEVNAASADNVTPLMRAAGSGCVEVVRTLLAAGADVNARSGAGHLAADYARSKLQFYLQNLDGVKRGVAEERMEVYRNVLRLLGAEN